MALRPFQLMLGGNDNPPFPRQFDTFIDSGSFACTPILYYDRHGNILENRHSSGAFIEVAGRKFLVTARHCVSLRDAFHDECLDDNLFEPHMIRVFPAFRDHRNMVRRATADILVRNDDGSRRWLEDPEFANLRTDIACLEVPANEAEDILTIGEGYSENGLYTHSGSNCFVVGFPSRNFAEPYFPIWRRGAIASEPRIPVNGQPIFLVDAMTSPGMSGSIVIQREFGPSARLGADGNLTTNLQAVVTNKLIGIYGGRVANNDALGDIGYCWYWNRIVQIVNPDN